MNGEDRIQKKKSTSKNKVVNPTLNVSLKEKQRKAATERKRRQRQKIKEDCVKYDLAKQAEKERSRKRREEKKIKSINDLSERGKRRQRAEWRKRYHKHATNKKNQRRINNFLMENSPPNSPVCENERHLEPNENAMNGLENAPEPVVQKKKSKRKKELRKCREKYKKKIKELEKELENERKKSNRWKQKHHRLRTPNSTTNSSETASPNSKAQTIMKDNNLVRRKLIVGEILASHFSTTDSPDSVCESEASSKKTSDYITKYKLGNDMRKIFGWRGKKRLFSDNNSFDKAFTQGKRQQTKINSRKNVVLFYEDDDNSYCTPGRRDTITKKKVKKQKRYLSDSLQNLHKKYESTFQVKISYAHFCKLKPFWVVHRPMNKRDTCLCKYHENFALLFQKCKQYKVLKHKNFKEFIGSLCCDIKNKNCMYRKCVNCQKKNVTFEESPDCPVYYFEWKLVTEDRTKNGKNVPVKVTRKCKIYCNLQQLKEKITLSVGPFMTHMYRVTHQSSFSKSMRTNLNKDEVFVIVDFSENYQFKYANEVQSRHFGASNEQLTLHTGAYFSLGEANEEDGSPKIEVNTFCTVSTCNRHDAPAIWAHLSPILSRIKQDHGHVKKLHILSDGPTKQYRNKSNLHLFCHFMHHFGFEGASYNFSESGHGKSIADGVGGVVKRTADRAVQNGKDISNIDQFLTSVQELKVQVVVIPEGEIYEYDKILTDKLIVPIPKTMKLHQSVWLADKKMTLHCRFLSCYDCRGSKDCIHDIETFCHDISHRPKTPHPYEDLNRILFLLFFAFLLLSCETFDYFVILRLL